MTLRSPSALLDFGFFTNTGDPAFDAAVTASIYDMYGPDAGRIEERLDREFAERFDYDRDRIGVYRAAYALSTSNCFSHSGRDGHFAWCIKMLMRNDIRSALQA